MVCSQISRLRCRRHFLFHKDFARFIQNAVARPAIAEVQTNREPEGFNDGIFFDHLVSGSAKDIDCTNGCSDGVHIGNSCSDITLNAVTVTSAPNIVRNDCSTKNIPHVPGGVFRTLSLYIQSNYGGNPAHATYWNGQQWLFE